MPLWGRVFTPSVPFDTLGQLTMSMIFYRTVLDCTVFICTFCVIMYHTVTRQAISLVESVNRK
jgi:hypothetical protein